MIGKRFLPASLFGRALLILLLPTIFIQAVMAYVFFDRHWGTVTRYMGKALAGDMAFMVNQVKTHPETNVPPVVRQFGSTTGIAIDREPKAFFPKSETSDYPEFEDILREQIKEPLLVRKHEGSIEVLVELPDRVLSLETTSKRLESPTTMIFLMWMAAATTVFLFIAVIFLRNQIRPIRKLAVAADNFGRGVDTPDFKPSGASEVRVAARAFLLMSERIKRQLRTRTEMLAGISHDLRTPLTRMKLQLAMLGDSDELRELKDDAQQMEHMIEEYLDFARGDTREDSRHVSVKALLADVVEDYRRAKSDVSIDASEDIEAELRETGFRRMLHNVIDNAVRYGTHCRVTLQPMHGAFEIYVDDDGPGIPEDKHDEVFQPFRRLDPSRNVNTGGVGLGLTIARDITLAHGGTIALARSPSGGLRVILHLPLKKE